MSDYQDQLRQLGGPPGSLEDLERAEIEQDLRTQGVDTTADEVMGTFGLFETATVDDDASPRPAFGPDFRYTPEPGEEELFADTSDMFFPPETVD